MQTLKFTAVLMAATVLSSGVAAHAQQAHAQTAATAPAKPAQASIVVVQTISPEIRRVTYANPPLNFIEPQTLVELNQVLKDLSKDDKVKVVIFDSNVSGFFYNHFDMNQFQAFVGQTGENSKPLWVELISNLENAPFVTIASIRGRTQGGGNELTLAFDLRYASKEKAIFNQPEVGIGLYPGGGGPDHLARLAGRDRTIEAFLSADDYNADTAEKYGWVTRSLPDAELDGFVLKMANRMATFDKTALVTTKRHINAITLPTEAERTASYGEFVQSLGWPGLQERMGVFGKIYQESGPAAVENNMGYYVGKGNADLQKSKK